MSGQPPDDILTGEASTCVNCRQHIYAVVDASSGCVDWGASFPGHAVDEQFFDFGCGDSPDTDDEGTGGHDPGPDHTPNGFRILVDSKSYWERIEAQKAAAR